MAGNMGGNHWYYQLSCEYGDCYSCWGGVKACVKQNGVLCEFRDNAQVCFERKCGSRVMKRAVEVISRLRFFILNHSQVLEEGNAYNSAEFLTKGIYFRLHCVLCENFHELVWNWSLRIKS